MLSGDYLMRSTKRKIPLLPQIAALKRDARKTKGAWGIS